MSDNLVDSMLQEMQANNSPADMNYAPNMSGQGAGASPVMQSHGSPPGMENMGYDMPPQDPRMQDMGGMDEDEMEMAYGRGEVPDMDTYGMGGPESEEAPRGGSMMSMPMDLLNSFKDPMMVIILAVILSLPQVNGPIRATLSQFVGNPLYVNVLMAVLLGLVFYLLKLVL